MTGLSGYDQWKTASPYDDDPGYEHADLEDAVKALDEGRNKDCFSVLSFGGKDADLEPCGCTGINAIRGMTGVTHPKILVDVGGHKTVSHPQDWLLELPPARIEELGDIATEIVCGCGIAGEWTGDDWSMGFNDTIRVDPVWDETVMELDYPATAQAIVKAARERCEEFSKQTRALSLMMKELYQEAEKEALDDGH